MAIAKKCDICGKLFEATFVPDITIHKHRNCCEEEKLDTCIDICLDICPECHTKLEKFVNKEE